MDSLSSRDKEDLPKIPRKEREWNPAARTLDASSLPFSDAASGARPQAWPPGGYLKHPIWKDSWSCFCPKDQWLGPLCLQGAQEYPPQCPTRNQCSRGNPRCPRTELDDKNTAPAEKQALCPTHTREIKCNSRVDAGECRLQSHAPGLSIISQKLGQRWRRMLGCVLVCARPARCLRSLSSPKPHVLVSRAA